MQFLEHKISRFPISFTADVYWKRLYELLLPCTKVYHFLPTFVLLLPTFTRFYHFPPTFINFLTFILLFIKQKWFFLHLLTCTIPTVLLDAMLQALILCLSHFYLPYVACIYFTPSNKFHMNNSFIVKIIIIRPNIIKIYSSKTHIITKKCDIIRINKDYVAIRKHSTIKISEYLFRDKATRNKFNNSRPASTSLSHASWVLYLSSQYFNIRCSLKKSFFTHLCLIAIRTYPIAWG